ncbi:MAG: hypothetical protein J6Y20_07615 [Lachnospiraceae bacterium]|nr:hypothetical protein [Lachnospiraceae bacterium]
MENIKINLDYVEALQSSWQCKVVSEPGQPKEYKFTSDSSPTWDSKSVPLTYSVPSGAIIKSAKVVATLGNPATGASVMSVNGNQMKQVSGSVYEAGITAVNNLLFEFKANGNKINTEKQTSYMSVSNAYVDISYEMPKGASNNPKPDSSGLTVPPQSCCIYDPSNGKVYIFDGVIRIQHQVTMKIEEEPSNKKEEFVNNARNEPDKCTLEIMMSDVYTGNGALDASGSMSSAQSSSRNAVKNMISVEDSRSANAYSILHALKESRRRVSVITPQYVHTDMIISSIVVNQDESCPYGWSGQIVFQRAFAAKAKTVQNGNAQQGGDTKKNTSVTYNAVSKLLSVGVNNGTTKTLKVTRETQ